VIKQELWQQPWILEDKLSKFPNKLSQGERQRVAICRALINDPKVILADEPTGNLDPENKTKIMKLLFDYVEQKGSTLITVTHDHELLSGFDRVVDF
jgi:putative ABC transport system ATP-binding protein